jgi:outer membrane protein OmpA-like peptidoglycan-associated protein
MQDTSSESRNPEKKIFHRVWFWLLIGLVLLVVLFFSMLPVGIDYGIEAYLKGQGADQVKLEDVDFNPLTGRMTLTNLRVVIGAQTLLQIPQATFKIGWTPFIRKRFVLERFAINDLEIVVAQLENGNWQIGGITLPAQEASAEPASWGFSLQEATATNCNIRLTSSQLTSDLAIEQANISKLTSWLYDDSARLELSGKLNDAPMQLQLDVSPFGSEILASGQLQLNGLTLKPFGQLLQPHLKTLAGRLDLDLNIETRQTADSGISHFQKGSVKLHQLHAQMLDMNISKNDLAWDGAVQVNLAKAEEGMKISADGQLNGSKLTLDSENENLMLQQDNFNWKGKFDYAQDKSSQRIAADGQISSVDLKVSSPQFNLAEDKLIWQGSIEFSTTANSESQRIITGGELNGSHLQMSLPDRKLRFEHQGLLWKGRLDTGKTNDFAALKAEGDVTVKDIQILQSETNQRLLNTNRFDLQAIKIDGLNTVNVAGIVLNGLALLAEPEAEPSSEADPTPLRIQEIKFENARLSQQKNLAIDAVRLTGAKGFLHRDREGKWPAIDRLASVRSNISSADHTQRNTADTRDEEKSDELGFRIGQIDISGDSGLHFKDNSVSPAFDMDLNILEARVADLDSSQPQEPASLKLLLSDKEGARLSLDGSMQPFAEKLSLDWVGKIKAFELPHLSPYVIQSTGYRFTSGELEANVPFKIDRNELEGEIDLMLLNPKIKSGKAEISGEKRRGKIRLNMTLDSALRLLRDEQNDVKLNIPISGDINDPQFNIADAVNQVLAKTLQKSALSYLKYMLGPYGIGISVAEFAYEQATKIRLNPIMFAPGNDGLDKAAIDYLQRVAAIMKEYPAVQVSVCGVATESDRTAMNKNTSTDTALLALARNRADRIEDYLVKLNGIDATRIIACVPEIDKTAEAKPRADLGI